MPERKTYLTTLERIENRTPTVRSFFLRLPQGERLEFKAGQFISVHLSKKGIKIRKPYSIASSPSDTTLLELCIKRVENGFVSNTFFSFLPGVQIPIDGPDGVFTLKNLGATDLFFIGTGTGVAPLRSMIYSIFNQELTNEVYLLFGVRNENEILYEEEFRSLAEVQPHFHFIPVVSRPLNWKGERGHVQDIIEKWIDKPEGKEVYLCGLPSMVDAVREKLKSIGFDRKQLHFEKYV
jgi:ferredoxin-NADP reductase